MTKQDKPLSVASIGELLGPIKLRDSEAESFIEALQERSPQAIRLHRNVVPESLPFELHPVPWFSHGYWVGSDVRPTRSLHYATGDYYVQDAGSLLAIAACDTRPGMRVCDLCAAPGGKASAITEMIGEDGWLLANEPIRSRLAPLVYNLSRTGSDRWVVSSMDPEELARRFQGTFDLVLVDAPCSGQALLSRGRQRTSALGGKQIDHSASRQQRILKSAVELLAPQGQLVYSTCTFAYKENEAHASWLTSEYSLSLSPSERLAPYQSAVGEACYRLWPHLHQCSGAFAMRLVNDGDASEPLRRVRANEPAFRETKPPAELAQWGSLENQRFFNDASRWFGWPDDIDERLITVATSGPEVAHLVGNTWQPSHALALRTTSGWRSEQTREMSDQEAAKFARGETIASDKRGWTAMMWNGRPIGWGKASGGMMKNQIPGYARMQVV